MTRRVYRSLSECILEILTICRWGSQLFFELRQHIRWESASTLPDLQELSDFFLLRVSYVSLSQDVDAEEYSNMIFSFSARVADTPVFLD